HGPLGAGGVANPGSLKGYIPAFWGADFDDLVRDDVELKAWIAKGEIPRLADHPVASRFLRRQAIKMPPYGRFVPEPDIDALVAWVRWGRVGAWGPLGRGWHRGGPSVRDPGEDGVLLRVGEEAPRHDRDVRTTLRHSAAAEPRRDALSEDLPREEAPADAARLHAIE